MTCGSRVQCFVAIQSLTGCDVNSVWDGPSRNGQPEVYYIRRHVLDVKAAGRAVVMLMDVHSHSSKPGVFLYGTPDDREEHHGGPMRSPGHSTRSLAATGPTSRRPPSPIPGTHRRWGAAGRLLTPGFSVCRGCVLAALPRVTAFSLARVWLCRRPSHRVGAWHQVSPLQREQLQVPRDEQVVWHGTCRHVARPSRAGVLHSRDVAGGLGLCALRPSRAAGHWHRNRRRCRGVHRRVTH